LAAVVLGFGLIGAPAALASGDSVHAGAGVPFSGVVDASPSCSNATSATIDWGDGSAKSPGTIDPSNGAISGSHTYAAAGSGNGTINLTGGTCGAAGAPTQDTFSVTVGPAPQFKQCPAIGEDGGCQFLIVASNSGTTILTDANQPAVDTGGDDALIGIQNNSSSPISSIPLSVPSTSLFGFEQDGLCDPGLSPVPSGCKPVGSSGICRPGVDTCTFPAPPGQPAGYVEHNPIPNSTQNGYEGPRNWYSNISLDESKGQVNFSPALQPGESTYFSLEEPPVGSSLNASSTPAQIGAPPTVSATSANFTAVVNPNGSATRVLFQYGINGRFGPAVPAFGQSTPAQNIGGDYSNHLIRATVSGLDPNAPYEVRVVATNKNGTAIGTVLFFRTKQLAPPGIPALGKTVNISVVSGIVLVKLHGVFVPLTQVLQVPTNTVIDTLHGTVKLVSSTGGVGPARDARAKKHKKSKAKTSSGNFGGAIFKVTQARSGPNKGQTTLTLVSDAFKGAPTFKSCGARGATDGAHAALSSRILQTLRSRATGRYRTRGRYASGTVRGTKWTTSDRCNGTLIAVQQHSVLVTDLVRHKTILVTAGHSYLARAPKGRKH
jgi:hypothetical protein